MRVGACAIFRDEAPYLPEWLAWHRRMGVREFYLYDNESTDGGAAVARASGPDVFVKPWPGQHQQVPAYCDALARAYRRVAWIVFVDLDEFVWSPRGRTIPEHLADVVDQDALWMPWHLFGWGPHATRPAGGTLENFLWRAPDDYPHHRLDDAHPGGKSIVRTGVTAGLENPHWFDVPRGVYAYDDPDDGLLVNHYYTRSREECRQRRLLKDNTGTDGHADYATALRIGDEASAVYDDRLARQARERAA